MLLIKKIFDYLVWVLFFGLFLLGGIIYATNRTYPGDYLYPFKLKFEDFALVTSRILNKQVDFSIDLVSKRSNEVAKVLTSKNAGETLNRLDTQVETTAISISKIESPIEKKKAAEKYIATLNEVSSTLNEKQKELIVSSADSNTGSQPVQQQPVGQRIQNIPSPTIKQNSQNNIPTAIPLPPVSPETSTVSQQINNTQATVEQTIDEMNELISEPIAPTDSPESNEDRDKRERKEKEEREKKEKEERDRESRGRD